MPSHHRYPSSPKLPPSSDDEFSFSEVQSTTPSRPPPSSRQQSQSQYPPSKPKTPITHNAAPSSPDDPETKEATLQRELQGVRAINTAIESIISTLERAKGNMGVCTPYLGQTHKANFLQTVSQTVTNASTLLNTWTRILSQTEHNQRLILSPNWKGASGDIADMEHEALLKQQEEERRAREAERRREEARRKAEEEERKRAAGTVSAGSGTTRGRGLARGTTTGRGRGAGLVRSTSSAGRTTTGTGIARGGGSTSSRGTSGIGRGGFGYGRVGAPGTRGARKET
uniref:DASH complex subunit DUO1 n=1 Tax=Podospora anserina (strain S / ATCC MYA-4624 / DSM 980 / FGSC 10383) TaxID=515849 RepID=A0A090CQ73_PODAN|nr:Putative protein of unknown function [Podospora anserina S mat+]